MKILPSLVLGTYSRGEATHHSDDDLVERTNVGDMPAGVGPCRHGRKKKIKMPLGSQREFVVFLHFTAFPGLIKFHELLTPSLPVRLDNNY